MASYRTRISIGDDDDVPVVVDYDCDLPCRGSFEPGGLQIKPDPGGIIINTVVIEATGEDFPPNKECEEKLEAEIAEYLHEASLPDPDRYRD
jgi:hypothetical protein